MEKEKSEEQEFIDNYNLGYTLNKYSPEMGELISGLDIQGNRIEAIKAGMQQYNLEHEKSKDWQPDWLKSDRLSKALEDRTIEPEKDKDVDLDRD